jgi:hypothetical protein
MADHAHEQYLNDDADIGAAHVDNEIVPQALRHRLGWDQRHDEMAGWITADFNLKLPRDRELIRQLAFVFVQESEKARRERIA